MNKNATDNYMPWAVEQVRELWMARAAVSDITRLTGVPSRAVRRLAAKHGWPTRLKGRPRSFKQPRPLPADLVEKARQLYAAGEPVTDICLAVGWRQHVFNRARRENGWPAPLVQRRSKGHWLEVSPEEEAASLAAGLKSSPAIAQAAAKVRRTLAPSEQQDGPGDGSTGLRVYTCDCRGIFRGASL